MKLEKLTKLKDGKYKLHFQNEEIVTYDDVILKHDLLMKKNVDKEKLEQLRLDTEQYELYNKLLKMISVRLRSEHEIRVYLTSLALKPTEIEMMIEKLKQSHFLDDRVFVTAYVNDQVNFTAHGPNWIRRSLWEHEISDELIQPTLATIEPSVWQQKIQKMIRKQQSKALKMSAYQWRQKVLSTCVQQGYDPEQVFPCLDQMTKSEVDPVRYQYQIWYPKLARKYQGDLLRQKLIQKLMQKGFRYEEIKSLLDETARE